MAERKPSRLPGPAGIEEQLWPTVCATLVLVGIMGVVIWQNSDFEEDRLLWNGYTHLAALAVGAALIIFIASRLKGTARRTAELAIVLSLAFHAVAGMGAFYLLSSPMTESGPSDAASDSQLAADEQPPPDYHWGQNDDQQEPEQAFEKTLITKIREQARPAAELKPRNMERPSPAADITRVPKVEISPLTVGAIVEPSRPPEIRTPESAKIKEAQTPEPLPPDALAMVRQKSDPGPLPKLEAPAPLAMPDALPESPKNPEPVQVKTGKLYRSDWAEVAKNMAEPDDPLRHKMARGRPASGDLPLPDIVARLPSRTPPQTPQGPAGTEGADRVTEQGSTLVRSNRDGLPFPSAVIPDSGLRAQSPAAIGSAAPSRLEAVSTVAVEKSDMSRAPLGPTLASNGAQDFATGSTLLPSRRGVINGAGKAQLSAAGSIADDIAELRSGSPAADLSKGLPLAAASARRARASQTEDGGDGPSASLGATLPRTQSEMGFDRPAAAKIEAGSALSGAGGAAAAPGGQISSLDVGQRIAVRRWAGAGAPSDNVGRGPTTRGPTAQGTGDGLPGGDTLARGNIAPGGFLGPGPRHVEAGGPEGDDTNNNGVSGNGSLPRAQADVVAPRSGTIPVGPVGGVAGGAVGGMSGGGYSGGTGQGLGSAAIAPDSGLAGIARRQNSGPGVGQRPADQVGPSEVAADVEIAAPQSLGGASRSRSDGQLDQILAGEGLGGIGRENSQVAVSGQVHEPMTAFRRGAVHGGLTLGDSVGGQLTEPAIENGLEYFSHSQFNDGHWSLHDSPAGASDPASMGSLHADTAATGLALLSFFAAGYTHQDEKYRDVVRRGVDWLVKHQQDDGNLAFHGSDPAYDPNSDPTNFYSHGIAAIALCEAYGMTQDRELREPAQKAIDFIVKSQDPSRGGWRYKAQEGSDTSVTGWQLMALKSAQMAGLEVPADTLRKVGHWLDLAQVPNRGTYVYNPWNADNDKERQGRAPSPTMTAQAMIMRMYLGQDHDQATLAQGADYLLAHLPEMEAQETTLRDCYYWYYATQAMYHMQGDYWRSWDARVTPLLRAGQIDRGPLKGSWDPSQPVLDRWSKLGGRHYVTSIHVLTLEFRYWHLPLFRELRRD